MVADGGERIEEGGLCAYREGDAFVALSIVSRMYLDGVTAAIFPPVLSKIVP